MITDDERTNMLVALRAGVYVPPLIATIIPFRQIEGESNAKFVRLTPRGLKRAPSWATKPFMRDHAQWDSLAVGGTILSSRLERDGDAAIFMQDVEVVKPWAQEGLLDGTILRFSIGWSPVDPREPFCSACGASMFTLECGHWPGQILETKKGPVLVEMIYDDIEGDETSAVPLPAVADTGVEGIRAALAAARGTDAPRNISITFYPGELAISTPATLARQITEALDAHKRKPQPQQEDIMPFKKLSARLGVAEDADEGAHLAAVDTMALATERASTLLTSEREAHEVTKGKLAKLELAASTAEQAQRDAVTTELVAKCRLKVGQVIGADGKPVLGGRAEERTLLTIAKLSLVDAAKFVAELPQLVAVGLGQSEKDPPVAIRGEGMVDGELAKSLAQLGIKPEDYAKHKPRLVRGEGR